jgi:hypothetical protein
VPIYNTAPSLKVFARLLAASDADITELSVFRRNSAMAGDLNAKHQLCDSVTDNASCDKLSGVFYANDFEISVP